MVPKSPGLIMIQEYVFCQVGQVSCPKAALMVFGTGGRMRMAAASGGQIIILAGIDTGQQCAVHLSFDALGKAYNAFNGMNSWVARLDP